LKISILVMRCSWVLTLMPSSSALIPMSICTLQCLFSHSFTTYEWLNRDCDVQIYIGITSRWTGYKGDLELVVFDWTDFSVLLIILVLLRFYTQFVKILYSVENLSSFEKIASIEKLSFVIIKWNCTTFNRMI
jgi:hypothetical protein